MTYKILQVQPISGCIGAEIYGVDLRQLDNKLLWEELKQAYLQYHVIAVRGQDLSPDDQTRAAEFFGQSCPYPFAKGMDEAHPYMTRIIKEPTERTNFGADWHSDTPYLQEPPSTTTLYAVETPPAGGDTLYANTEAAYQALSDTMKKMLDGLQGVFSASLKHKPGGNRKIHHARINTMAVQNSGEADRLESIHPIVRTHPLTGKKALYVSALHTLRFEGSTEKESRPLIQMLNDHCIEPQFTCRVRWQPGQFNIWDNRCTMHNAINDYHGHRREMRRLTVGSQKPE
jgi:taurine dioxygenase